MNKLLMNQIHLTFHSIKSKGKEGWDNVMSCSPERLRTLIRTLKKMGYEIIPASMVMNKACSDRKIATLSFDDGYIDNFTDAFPVLLEEKVSGMFAIITCTLEGILPPNIIIDTAIRMHGHRSVSELMSQHLHGTPWAELLTTNYNPTGHPFLSSPPEVKRIKRVFNCLLPRSIRWELSQEIFRTMLEDSVGSQESCCSKTYMSVDNIQAMLAGGMEIGSHTHTHVMLHSQSRDEILQETKNSLTVLQNKVPNYLDTQPGKHLVFPYGSKILPGILKTSLAGLGSIFWNRIIDLDGYPGEPVELPFVNRIEHHLFEQVVGIGPIKNY